jgi:hypothetical protein
MKNFIYTVPGGGIFSRFFQCGIVPLADKDFDNVYLSLSPFDEVINNMDSFLRNMVNNVAAHREAMESYGISNPYEHIVSYVLDQKTDISYRYDGYLPVSKFYDRHNPIELSPRLDDYKKTLSKIHIKNTIKNSVYSFCSDNNIGTKTLGVHIRMTTMVLHPNLKSITYEEYCDTIDKCLETENYENVYVASDNNESIIKLKNRYGKNIVYYPNLLRLHTEKLNGPTDISWEYDMFFRKKFWVEAFMECMTLANCGGLVCRDSNFSNMAIVFSNSIKNIYRP